jgi:hypothetical protein
LPWCRSHVLKNLSLTAPPAPVAGTRRRHTRIPPGGARWARPWGDGGAHLVASGLGEQARNDLRSGRAHLGAPPPGRRTPQDGPAQPCPESPPLPRGSPPSTPGGHAATPTRAARRATVTCSRACASAPAARLVPAAGPASSPATRSSLPPQGALQASGPAITARQAGAPPRPSRGASADDGPEPPVGGTTDSRPDGADSGASPTPSRAPSSVGAAGRPG